MLITQGTLDIAPPYRRTAGENIAKGQNAITGVRFMPGLRYTIIQHNAQEQHGAMVELRPYTAARTTLLLLLLLHAPLNLYTNMSRNVSVWLRR